MRRCAEEEPPEVVDRLNKAILADPKSKARFTEIVPPGSAAEFGKLVADETEKFAGAKMD